jgi:hypothetical protein
MDFAFLQSERFWAIVIAAVTLYLQQKGYIGEAELALIGTLTAGFVTVGTVDRLGKNLGMTEAQSKVNIAEEKASSSK